MMFGPFLALNAQLDTLLGEASEWLDTVIDDGQRKLPERRAAEGVIVDVDGFEGLLDPVA